MARRSRSLAVACALAAGAGVPASAFAQDCPGASFAGQVLTAGYSSTLGDIDGDGDLDRVTIDQWPIWNNLSIRLNDGNGTFGPAILKTVVNGGRYVTLVDLDNDGDLDITGANYNGGRIFVWPNDGDGGFVGTPDEYPIMGPMGVAFGDVNGDGFVDMLGPASNGGPGGNALVVRMNNGAGLFGAAVNYMAPSSPQFVCAGDVDGDSDVDAIVISFRPTGNVSVFLNDGTGLFAAGVPYSAGPSPRTGVLADLDADGDLDLSTANSANGTVSIMLNNGNGTFAAPVHTTVGGEPWGLTAGDIDADGDDDLTVGNSAAGVAVLSNDGNAGFTAAYSVAAGGGTSVVLGDINGDAALDMITASRVLFNAGDGTIRGIDAHAAGINPTKFALADLNGDTRLDAFVLNNGSPDAQVLLNTAAGFAPGSPVNVDSNQLGIALGNFDGDADIDAVVVNYGSNTANIMLNNGAGVFGARTPFPAGPVPTDVATGDLDGDGDVDLLIANNSDTATVRVLLNNGNATFAPAIAYAAVGSAVTVRLADLDGDGDLDAVATSEGGVPAGQEIGVLINNGAGVFAAPVKHGGGTGTRYSVLADIDNDTDVDIVVAHEGGTPAVRVLRNSGAGTFAAAQVYTVPASPRGLAVRDIDGDGFADVAVTTPISTSVYLMYNAGDGTFLTPQQYVADVGASFLALADLDNDRRTDIVTTSATGGGLSVIFNSATDAAIVTEQPDDAAVCPGQSAEFSVGVAGLGPFTYQWRKAGTAINGATGSTFTIASASPEDVGGYDVVITDACGSTASRSAELTLSTKNCCPADWNGDGTVNSTDVSDFINDWFTDQAKGSLITDFNDDGVSNSTDVSDFINRWFEDQAACGG